MANVRHRNGDQSPMGRRSRPDRPRLIRPSQGRWLRSLLLFGTAAIAAIALTSHLAAAQVPTAPIAQAAPNRLAQSMRDRQPMPQPTPQPPVGGLYNASPDGPQERFVLDRTEVNAKVSGNLARVEVTQTFTNPFPEPLEAVYIFPLPDEAAVDEMEIRVGDRVIKGDIKKREDARRIYEQARQEGRTAGLLEQERANIFTQSVANIRPGESIQVTIRYSESLQFSGGEYEFVFPMVVGPRYIPGTPIDDRGSTNRVPDGGRINPPILPPDIRSGNDIRLTVDLDAGVPIRELNAVSHAIEIRGPISAPRVFLSNQDTIPNKDFILRYRVADRETQATVLTQADDRGGHFAAYLIPAIDYPAKAIVPKDVVFLMDTSGSQQGAPIAQSKALMHRFIDGLNADDTFAIVDFANTTTRLSPAPLPNTAANRAIAHRYIDRLDANGGTNLMEGIDAVLGFPAAPNERLRTVVLMTDGYIGNDVAVIGAVRAQLQKRNRLFSFGVGSSVNRFLIDRLAEVGRGTAQMVRQDEPLDRAVETFTTQIANPVLTDVTVRWEGKGPAPVLYPSAAPDLFAAQPLVLFGKKADREPGTLIISGTTANGRPYEKRFAIAFDRPDDQAGTTASPATNNPAIAQLWGRARLKDLMLSMNGGEVASLVEQATQTALDYRLLSNYTAFVAVSEEVRVAPDGTRRTVRVPVEMPQGVSHEGIFGDMEGMGVPRAMGMPPAPNPAATRGGNRRSGPPMGSAPTRPADTTPLSEVDGAIAPLPAAPRLRVTRADRFDAAARTALEQAAGNVFAIGDDISGTLVLTLEIRNGRIVRMVVNDRASTVSDAVTIVRLRRVLQGLAVAVPDGQSRVDLEIAP